jgi:hypothetical protein
LSTEVKRQFAGLTENFKSQISNNKQITMTKIPNSNPVLVIEYWNLRLICNLVLGIWDLGYGIWDFIDSSTLVLQNSLQSLTEAEFMKLFHST